MNLAAIKKNAPSRRDLEGANHGTIRFLLPFVSPSVWLLGGRAARAAGPPVSLNPQQGVLKQVRLMRSPRRRESRDAPAVRDPPPHPRHRVDQQPLLSRVVPPQRELLAAHRACRLAAARRQAEHGLKHCRRTAARRAVGGGGAAARRRLQRVEDGGRRVVRVGVDVALPLLYWQVPPAWR